MVAKQGFLTGIKVTPPRQKVTRRNRVPHCGLRRRHLPHSRYHHVIILVACHCRLPPLPTSSLALSHPYRCSSICSFLSHSPNAPGSEVAPDVCRGPTPSLDATPVVYRRLVASTWALSSAAGETPASITMLRLWPFAYGRLLLYPLPSLPPCLLSRSPGNMRKAGRVQESHQRILDSINGYLPQVMTVKYICHPRTHTCYFDMEESASKTHKCTLDVEGTSTTSSLVANNFAAAGGRVRRAPVELTQPSPPFRPHHLNHNRHHLNHNRSLQ